MEELYGNPGDVWRGWADDLRGAPIESAHHMAEEAPEATADVLLDFVGGR